MKIKTRLLKGHKKGCVGLNHDYGPWCLLGRYLDGRGGSYYGDSIGRKRKSGFRAWLIALCLDTECTAELAVREEDILKVLNSK